MDEQGIVIGTAGIARDISERKRAEQAMREANLVVENSPVVLFRRKPTEGWPVEMVSQNVRQWGYTPEELLSDGEPFASLIYPEDLERVNREVQEFSASGMEKFQQEYRIVTKNGRVRWVDDRTAVERNLDGMIIYLQGVVIDITDRKALETSERDQRQLAEALSNSARTLNSTLNLEDVLDRILDEIEKIVFCDAVMILMIDAQGNHMVRYRSKFHTEIDHNDISNSQADLINMPILNSIIETRQPQIISDTETDPRWRNVTELRWIRSFMSAPLETRGQVTGTINLASAVPDSFTPQQSQQLLAFSNQAAIAIENATLYQQLHQISITDPLTELYNRRHFFETANIEFERWRRYGGRLSVIMADIDHFKNLNDTYGHQVGDLALRETARRIKSSIRTVDIAARYGGEEFVVLMPETGLDAARQVAERVRQCVAGQPLLDSNKEITATLSLGVTEIDENCNTMDDVVKCADLALYAAKSAGRNRVEIHPKPVDIEHEQ